MRESSARRSSSRIEETSSRNACLFEINHRCAIIVCLRSLVEGHLHSTVMASMISVKHSLEEALMLESVYEDATEGAPFVGGRRLCY